MTISTLKNYRGGFNFTNRWEKAKFISKNVKIWTKTNRDEIQFKENYLPCG